MDAITLATLTSAATLLATDAARGLASEAGISAWEGIKRLLGWEREPEAENLARGIAEALDGDPPLAQEVLSYLKLQGIGPSGALVGSITAKNVVVGDHVEFHKDVSFS
jgi:hypothetical protein